MLSNLLNSYYHHNCRRRRRPVAISTKGRIFPLVLALNSKHCMRVNKYFDRVFISLFFVTSLPRFHPVTAFSIIRKTSSRTTTITTTTTETAAAITHRAPNNIYNRKRWVTGQQAQLFLPQIGIVTSTSRLYSTSRPVNMPRGVKKENLPEKMCVTCGRPFTWRKKWERVWDEVTTCSKSCNRKRRLAKQDDNRKSNGSSSSLTAGDDHDASSSSVVMVVDDNDDTITKTKAKTKAKTKTTKITIGGDDDIPELFHDHEHSPVLNDAESVSSSRSDKGDAKNNDNDASMMGADLLFEAMFRNVPESDLITILDGEDDDDGGSVGGNTSETAIATATATAGETKKYLEEEVEYMDVAARRKAERKAAKKAMKAERRAQREGRGNPSAGQKPCDMCGKSVNLLVRCMYEEGQVDWKMVCGKCWNVASGGVVDGDGDHPHYRYGGLWKNRRKQQ